MAERFKNFPITTWSLGCYWMILSMFLKSLQSALDTIWTVLVQLHSQMGRVKRIWYLSPMRAAKVQVRLRGWRACASAQSHQNLRCSLIQAVSQEEPSGRKPDPWLLWMAGHAQLKFVMAECSKTQIRLACQKSDEHQYTAYCNHYIWVVTQQNQQKSHPPSLIRVFTVRSEFSLGAQVILLVLSWGSSFRKETLTIL